MVTAPDDRIKAVRSLMEVLGGSLELIYWDVDNRASWTIADLPDALNDPAPAASQEWRDR
jgi:hypothetical protein